MNYLIQITQFGFNNSIIPLITKDHISCSGFLILQVGVCKVNIDVADRHYNLMSNRIDNYSEWLTNANQKDAGGFGTYVFQVN